MLKAISRYSILTIICISIISLTCSKDSTGSGNGDTNNPEINIKVDGTNIASGTGSYNFGDIEIGSSSTIYTFIIENLGGAELNLTGIPIVSVTGTDAVDFTVIQQPNANIAEGDSTELAMQFTPSSEGDKTATVTIPNTDSDEDTYTFTTSGKGLEPAFNTTEIAQNFQTLVNIPTTSEVIFVGPVEPGTIIQEQGFEADINTGLTIPNDLGSYFVFIIDDEPDARFSHDMRYAWYDIDSQNFDIMEALMPAILYRPNIDPSPFEVVENLNINGIQFTFATGEGKFVSEDVSHKGEASSIGKYKIQQYKPLREPRKMAFVVEAAAENSWYEMDSKPIADWTEDEGFSTYSTSQAPGNSQDQYKSAAGIASYIGSVGQVFQSLGEPECGCDEFFIYITAHGYPYFTKAGKAIGSAIQVKRHESDGVKISFLYYKNIYDAIKNNFPPYSKVTLVIDACYSGRAIADHVTLINEICSNICGLTVLTACSPFVTTPTAKSGAITSASQKFTAGANLDHDGDGIKGDIKDRFAEMDGRQGSLDSKSFHCPEGGSWCSLDSPPPPEEVAQCTGVVHGSTSSTITVCIKYCNVPDGQYTCDIALYGPSPGTASVTVVNGEACVEFPINWYGDYTWTATLNPGGLPSTGAITVTAADVPCTY